ncbi:DUF1517 domain-containing protein [Deinococcus reticulitermitis]|uniref:DUF1517 domain-containing protein n=1 Tax=Deinococcus reticulitermitis TaxID=856736 RepID=UPI001160BA66|nr:DUF1517 domain-containing protein [Deinococcus reticulitermitis]
MLRWRIRWWLLALLLASPPLLGVWVLGRGGVPLWPGNFGEVASALLLFTPLFLPPSPLFFVWVALCFWALFANDRAPAVVAEVQLLLHPDGDPRPLLRERWVRDVEAVSGDLQDLGPVARGEAQRHLREVCVLLLARERWWTYGASRVQHTTRRRARHLFRRWRAQSQAREGQPGPGDAGPKDVGPGYVGVTLLVLADGQLDDPPGDLHKLRAWLSGLTNIWDVMVGGVMVDWTPQDLRALHSDDEAWLLYPGVTKL